MILIHWKVQFLSQDINYWVHYTFKQWQHMFNYPLCCDLYLGVYPSQEIDNKCFSQNENKPKTFKLGLGKQMEPRFGVNAKECKQTPTLIEN